MRCLTLLEAKKALAPWLNENGELRRGEPDMKYAQFYLGAESFTRLYWIASRLVECLGPWEDAWLWLEQPDTWNRQGLHLYSRLRQSYGELRLLVEAPVHQFHGFETADLCSFLAIALVNEWSVGVVTSHDYGRLFISQSSGAEAWFRDEDRLHAVEADLTAGGIGVQTGSTPTRK